MSVNLVECLICKSEFDEANIGKYCTMEHCVLCIDCENMIKEHYFHIHQNVPCPLCRAIIFEQPNIIPEQVHIPLGAIFHAPEIPMNGLYTYIAPNGVKLEECMYVNGNRHGLYQKWCMNGNKIQECTYENGVLNGLYQLWCQNGIKIEEWTYENGILNGLCQCWCQNGIKIEECTYVNGVRHGLSTKWTQAGIMCQQSTYENGVLVN